jgi:pyruvate/2-oxoacid:ferredoxin oxidoreductase beta subunit/Pyruvate/2-oxoacid:ferredoxin oxidoreductase gamma subunit
MAQNQYLAPEAKLPYCRGCGHAQVVRHLSGALERLQLAPRSVVLTTDIGCVGLADSLFPYLHTVHTTHGRSTAFATGMSLAEVVLEPTGLKPVVLIGDGGAMLGLLHLVHAAQLNADITVLVHNNFLFGMTGGQHSALTPLGFVTATTPTGNRTPPLDLLALLRAAHAGFLARQYATDKELAAVIADAIAYPGFALVEILELCTGYSTRWKPLSGSALKEVVARQGYALGRLEAEAERPMFRELYGQQLESLPRRTSAPEMVQASREAALAAELRLVVAGSAGERVQSAAALFCQAALSAGLYTTQKNDNPVTQGTGFSLAEICLSPRPIEYTGMESPDVVIVVSSEGCQELHRNGTFAHCRPQTLLVIDAEFDVPQVTGCLLRFPLRRAARPKRAALAGLAAWLARTSILPSTSWEAALATFSDERRVEAREALRIGQQLAENKTVTES